MNTNGNDELIYSKKVAEFITVANEYCLFIEEIEKYTKEDVLSYFQKVIPLLYLKGSLLPHVEVEDNDALEHYVTEEKWEEVFGRLKSKLGSDDVYFLLDEEADNDKETTKISASLSDNLSDVYQDVKDFIMLYQKGTHAAKENAVSDCKTLFERHWGIRAINAHRQVHQTLHKQHEAKDNLE